MTSYEQKRKGIDRNRGETDTNCNDRRGIDMERNRDDACVKRKGYEMSRSDVM